VTRETGEVRGEIALVAAPERHRRRPSREDIGYLRDTDDRGSLREMKRGASEGSVMIESVARDNTLTRLNLE